MKKIIALTPCIVIILFIVLPTTNKDDSQLYVSSVDNIDGLAFYLQAEEGSEKYESVDTIPSKTDGYVFKEAVCNDNSSVTFNSSSWSVSIANMENGKVRCKLYFDKYQYCVNFLKNIKIPFYFVQFITKF